MADALVDDGKAEGVAVGGRQIARQRTDAFDGAGLGSHVAANRTRSHAALEGAVFASDGERGKEVAIDSLITIGITKSRHEELRREIVVEREPTAVGHLVGGAANADVTKKLRDKAAATFVVGVWVATLCRHLIEEGFGKKIVALLHHGQENLVNGVHALCQRDGAARCLCVAYLRSITEAVLAQGRKKMLFETCTALIKERGEGRGVVVPTPTPAHSGGVLQTAVEIDMTSDVADAVAV